MYSFDTINKIFLISFLVLQLYGNTIDFCFVYWYKLICVYAQLFFCFVAWTDLLVLIFWCVDSSEFSICKIMSSTNTDSFTSSFPTSFLPFSCSNALVRTSSSVFNRSGQTCLALFPMFRGKIFTLFLLSVIIATGFSLMSFFRLRKLPSICSLLGFCLFHCLNHERKLEFVKWFFCVYWNDYVVFLLYSFNMVYCTDWFSYCKWILHSWDKFQLVIVYNIILSISY